MNPTPELIGKTVKVWWNHADRAVAHAFKGKVIGYCDHPTIIVEDASGTQHYFSSQLRFEVQDLPPEPPTGSAVATPYSVWLRGHGGWFDGFEPDEGRKFLTWEQLHLAHDVRPLGYVEPLPPFSGPLGFTDDLGRHMRLQRLAGPLRRARITIDDVQVVAVDLAPDQAKLAGEALLRIAQDAEQVTGDGN
jgi:hypothetical protein